MASFQAINLALFNKTISASIVAALGGTPLDVSASSVSNIVVVAASSSRKLRLQSQAKKQQQYYEEDAKGKHIAAASQESEFEEDVEVEEISSAMSASAQLHSHTLLQSEIQACRTQRCPLISTTQPH